MFYLEIFRQIGPPLHNKQNLLLHSIMHTYILRTFHRVNLTINAAHLSSDFLYLCKNAYMSEIRHLRISYILYQREIYLEKFDLYTFITLIFSGKKGPEFNTSTDVKLESIFPIVILPLNCYQKNTFAIAVLKFM